MKRLLMVDIHQRIFDHHGDNVTLDEKSYVNLRTRCRFIDKDYGEWWTDPWSVISGRGNPRRARATMSAKQTIARNEMIKRLQDACGDTVTLGDDFQGVSRKCTFIDRDYGDWVQLPQRVLAGTVHPKRRAEKARTTCMKRYGVIHTNHLPGVMSKGRTRWSKRIHWKTSEELTCMSSYEVAFVEWCAKNQIDFEWQVKHIMPDGRAYFVDARILTGKFADTWIEIKGWMHPSGQKKWEWFHSLHLRSELWTKDILQRLGILNRKQSQ